MIPIGQITARKMAQNKNTHFRSCYSFRHVINEWLLIFKFGRLSDDQMSCDHLSNGHLFTLWLISVAPVPEATFRC